MNVRPLSQRQKQILNVLTAHIKDVGFAPSVRELCKSVGLRSTSTMAYQLDILEARGYIHRSNFKSRAISLPNQFDVYEWHHYMLENERARQEYDRTPNLTRAVKGNWSINWPVGDVLKVYLACRSTGGATPPDESAIARQIKHNGGLATKRPESAQTLPGLALPNLTPEHQ